MLICSTKFNRHSANLFTLQSKGYPCVHFVICNLHVQSKGIPFAGYRVKREILLAIAVGNLNKKGTYILWTALSKGKNLKYGERKTIKTLWSIQSILFLFPLSAHVFPFFFFSFFRVSQIRVWSCSILPQTASNDNLS